MSQQKLSVDSVVIFINSTSVCIKKFALQNALRYNFTLLSPARFSEFDGIFFLPMLFLRIFFHMLKLRVSSCPLTPPPPRATVNSRLLQVSVQLFES